MDLNFEFSKLVAENFPEKPKAILIALSGGIDSMALLFIANSWAKENGVKVFSVTIDHMLRENSGEEALELYDMMIAEKIPHEILIWHGGKDIKSNIEAEARKARYKLLSKYALDKKIEVILTAHHLDDQIETFFIRLLRGSGIDGLSSMSKLQQLSENIKLFRPFLDIKKQILKDYLIEHNKKWFEDQTNKDTKFTRNKVRSVLEQIENKELIDKRISQTIVHFARAKDFLSQYTEGIFIAMVKKEADIYIMDIEKFKKIHQEIALRLLIRIFKEIAGHDYKPRFENLKALYQRIINNEVNKKTSFAKCFIEIKGLELRFFAENV